jgi:5-methylcytosine-specific restriction endonuclease McrA
MPYPSRQRCRQGHEWTEENTIRRSDGRGRTCRECNLNHYRRFRETRIEEERERCRRFDREHPEQARARGRKRRALKKSQLGLWDEDWFIERQLFIYQDGRCFYCREPINLFDRSSFHLEHVIPLSRGGLHCVSNVVLACPPCNLSKKNKTIEEWKCQPR